MGVGEDTERGRQPARPTTAPSPPRHNVLRLSSSSPRLFRLRHNNGHGPSTHPAGMARRIRRRSGAAVPRPHAVRVHPHVQAGPRRRAVPLVGEHGGVPPLVQRAPTRRDWLRELVVAPAGAPGRRVGEAMGPISAPQVEELRDALQRHGVTYLFIGKTGAILHGFPDTTQDADLFMQKTLHRLAPPRSRSYETLCSATASPTCSSARPARSSTAFPTPHRTPTCSCRRRSRTAPLRSQPSMSWASS